MIEFLLCLCMISLLCIPANNLCKWYQSAIIIISLFVWAALQKVGDVTTSIGIHLCVPRLRASERTNERKQITESVLVKNERGAVMRSANRIILIREWCAKKKKKSNLI